MHFKKLELVGFKSFMDKTTLHFEPGITAVVGPNGCGKSNIFDAIRWVLGEQSVKSLRGANMEDVIFNGTDLKQPLGMAEVSLTFDNDNKFFSLDHNEVTITRRIFRSGESEYLINRATVRLKDILDLLMGTGIGAESYSIVAQGKIDLILSSRPEDRRMVFDEASGITKYKSQKREALRRLEDTEQNLLRVNDIITEVKRSIGHLERQANKARKYKELFEDLKNKEIVMSVLERDIVTKEKTGLDSQIEGLKSQESGLQEIIKEDELKLNCFNDELTAWEDNISAVKNEIINLENLVLRDKQHIGFNQKRAAELEESNESSAAQMEQTKARLLQDEERLNALKSEHAAMKAGLDDKSLALKEKEIFLEGLVESIRLSLENITRSKKNILEIANQLTHTKNAIVDLNSKQHVFSARKKRLDLEKAKVYEEKIQIEDSLKGLVSELAGIQAALDEFNSKVTNLS
ncbi:chromosome segregation protein SMC, partial [bacterium]